MIKGEKKEMSQQLFLSADKRCLFIKMFSLLIIT